GTRTLDLAVVGEQGRRTRHCRSCQRQHDRARAQKNTLQPHRRQHWVIPPKANSAFVAAMEDVLAVDTRPRDGDCPLVCLDETSKQLIAETRVPIPMKAGRPAPNPRRVFMSGQKRGVFGRIKRELRRRSAIEAVIGQVIGHMKAEGHLGRCYLKGRAGDAANVILSAVGYNLRLVLAWLRTILRVVLLALFQTFAIRLALKPAF